MPYSRKRRTQKRFDILKTLKTMFGGWRKTASRKSLNAVSNKSTSKTVQ